MWPELRKKTKVKFEWDKAEWEPRIHSIEVNSRLDEPARMTVSVALAQKDLSSLALSALPKSGAFNWNGRTVFRGHLSGINVGTAGQVQIQFADELHLAKRVSENEFFKQQTLQDILGKICSWIGVESSFTGDFSSIVPGFSFGDRSLFDLLVELGSNYGFFFYRPPASSRISFLKLDASKDKKPLKLEKHLTSINYGANADMRFEAVEVSVFDPSSAASKKREISAGALYGALGNFSGHPGFSAKKSWPLSKARLETHVASPAQFESAEALFRARLSKRAMGQETVNIRAYEPLALPGDTVDVSGPGALRVQEGTYLVAGVQIQLDAAIPRIEMTAVRA